MIKYRFFLGSVLFLSFIWVSVFSARTAVFSPGLTTVEVDTQTVSDSTTGERKTLHKQRPGPDGSYPVTVNSQDNSNVGHYETIDETIARIKRDVQVTGAILGAHGQEKAFFQIEGMPDRAFKINTQLMDGFIITAITNNHVVLKNQSGDETFSLSVR